MTIKAKKQTKFITQAQLKKDARKDKVCIGSKMKNCFIANDKHITKFKIEEMSPEFKERYHSNPHFFEETVEYPLGILIVFIHNRKQVIEVVHRKDIEIAKINKWLKGFGLGVRLLKTRQN